jgi:hypothetical protein
LLDEKAVAEAVSAVLDRLGALLTRPRAMRTTLRVISSLAEGADRIVVHEVLRRTGSSLEAVLPLPQQEYEEDFAAASRAEFRHLLLRADTVTELNPVAGRDVAYARAGDAVLDRCDVLLAVWDGAPARGEGGTANVVGKARLRKFPLYWIHSGTGDWLEERESNLPHDESADLHAYNSPRPRIRTAHFARRSEGRRTELSRALANAELDAASFALLCDWHVPAFVRADYLADRYRRLHSVVGDALYFLAALAVVTVAAQVLFAPHTPKFAWVEVGLLGVLLLILRVARLARVHERWLSYRLLAERLRASFFTAFCDAQISRGAASETIYPVVDSERWLKRAFDVVWFGRPPIESDTWSAAGAKELVADAWVNDQLKYFQGALRKNGARLRKLARFSQGFFLVTLIAAALHAWGFGDTELGPSLLGKLVALTTVALPALGVALSGIRAQREYARNSERFASMVRHVTEARQRLESAETKQDVRTEVANLDAVMMEENRDWFVVMRFRDPELPA